MVGGLAAETVNPLPVIESSRLNADVPITALMVRRNEPMSVEIQDRIRAIIAEQLSQDLEEVVPEASL